jgi:hypothetical protein
MQADQAFSKCAFLSKTGVPCQFSEVYNFRTIKASNQIRTYHLYCGQKHCKTLGETKVRTLKPTQEVRVMVRH